MRWTELPDFKERNLCAFSDMKKSQVKLEVTTPPIMSQPGRNKLGQQRYGPSKDLVSRWVPDRARNKARMSQTDSKWAWMSKIESVSPRESQSEPERPRVSQKEFGSGLKVPCSQLIMHDNEMEIGSQTRQWDWLTNHYNERGIGWQTAKKRQILAHRAIIAGSCRPCSNSLLDYQYMFCT